MGVKQALVAGAQPDAFLPVLVNGVDVGLHFCAFIGHEGGLEGVFPRAEVYFPNAVQAADVGGVRVGHDEGVQRDGGVHEASPLPCAGREREEGGPFPGADLVEMPVGGFHHERGAVVQGAAFRRVGGGLVEELPAGTGVASQCAGAEEQVEPPVVGFHVLQGACIGGQCQPASVFRVPQSFGCDKPQGLFGIQEQVGDFFRGSHAAEHVCGLFQIAFVAQVKAPGLFPFFHPQQVVFAHVDMIGAGVTGQRAYVGVAAVDVAELHAVVEVDVSAGGEYHPPVWQLEDVLHLVVAQSVLCVQTGKQVGHGRQAFWQAGPRCAEDGCVTPCEAADKGLAFYPPLLSQRYFAESDRRRGGTGRGGTSRHVPYDGKRQGMKKAGEVSLSRRARSHSCGLSPRGIRTCIRTAERPSRRRHKKPDGTGHRCRSLRTHRRLRGRR